MPFVRGRGGLIIIQRVLDGDRWLLDRSEAGARSRHGRPHRTLSPETAYRWQGRRTGPVIKSSCTWRCDSASQGAKKMQTQANEAWGPRPCGILQMKTQKVMRAVVNVTVNVEKLVLYLLIGLSALRCH